ncbi:MAG: hypothetical protein ACRDJ1_09170 [Actinomycetota bacterium]
MTVEVTPRALAVLARALEAGRMDPGRVGIRVTIATGPRGPEVRTGFADEPEPGDVSLTLGGITLFIQAELDERGATLDVSDEHDVIVLR